MSRQDGGFEGGGVIHSRLMILKAVTLRVLEAESLTVDSFPEWGRMFMS